MKKSKGYLCLVLHAHLPFVRHPEYPDFLEEDWLFEAITETYMPLLKVLEKLEEDSVPYGITISLSPPLLSLLNDWVLQERYMSRLEKLTELASKEVDRTRWDARMNRLALMYYWFFENTRKTYAEKYSRDLVSVFRRLNDAGHVEITTCGATHGFLPLMTVNRNAVRAQVEIACRYHQRNFGRRPNGIWLPECGYEPGIDEILKESGIKFFFTDTHGILHASPRPRYGVFAPIYCPTGVAAFGRDMESSKQVWSAQEGYPGDFYYRDFYRDVGFDLEYDYVKPYLHGGGARVYTGIKYYRITGRGDHKEPYEPDIAREKAAAHAGNFMFNREQQVRHLNDLLGREPIIVAPYDAELFGHWWFEGPQWLDFLIRKCAYDQNLFSLITPSGYLARHPRNQVATPSLSSWGWKGYSEVWLEGSNDWIYRHLHWAADRMVELANDGDMGDPVRARALKQAARELLLAQGSDWAFIMKTGTAVAYASRRTKEHIGRFKKLYDDLRHGTIDINWLSDVEGRDNIFPELDYRIYADAYTAIATAARG
ncbi:MAG: 1,4-alpha-glucan branching protein domain-containing protein [Candidatus Eisenbacteria bacterium]